jgi:hypothetical protein
VGDVDKEILVRQNPLHSRGELLVVVDNENGFKGEAVHGVILSKWRSRIRALRNFVGMRAFSANNPYP